MKHHLFSLLIPLLAMTLGAAPSATVSCQRDLLPNGSAFEIDGLPGGASIKSGGGKTVIKAPLFSEATVYDLQCADPATVSQEAEAGPVELAFLPIEPAPARIEEALCKAPTITTANGYQRHAWLAQYRQPERLVSCDPLGLIWRGPRNYDRLT